MKVPFSWLKEYIEYDLTLSLVRDTLTLGGLEVEKVELPDCFFQGVVVGKIISTSIHPKADRLQIATVFDGKENYQVVCGAPNCRPGLKTAFAKIDATLKDEKGKQFKIKKAVLRESESFGMLCSEKELGLSQEDKGIMELPLDLVEGTDLSAYLLDPILEISLTPNLGHCMSVLGISRELCALLNCKMKNPPFFIKEEEKNRIEEMIEVEILDQEACPRYACRILQDVKVNSSPSWLKKRIEACGLKSINHVVDITNLIMLELGQPLHAFDYDKISGKKIKVDSSQKELSFVTLDGKKQIVPIGTLLISDAEKPLALAGIMGGVSSSVSESTHTILLEAAYFNPQKIRKATKTLGIRTDASQRFERNVDFNGGLKALDKASFLIQELSQATIVKGIIEKGAHHFAQKTISCRVSQSNKILGTKLSRNEIISLLERLEMVLEKEEEDKLYFSIPSYRNDLQVEIDLIEEIGRIYGYEHIPKQTPYYPSSSINDTPLYGFENQVRDLLIAEGLQECITCDLISPLLAEITKENSSSPEALIHVLHPSSIDQSILRTTLLPGLLETIQRNIDHQNSDIAIFEVGKIHFREKNFLNEQTVAAIALCGHRDPYHHDPKPRESDFFDLKGIMENVFETLISSKFSIESSDLHNFHPRRQAQLIFEENIMGVLGEVHPEHLKKLGIKKRVYFAEINLHDLFLKRRHLFQSKKLPEYPASERDWTLTISDTLPIATIFKLIEEKKFPLLEKVLLLDLYKSEQIGKDRRNVTLRFIYRDLEKTLSIEMVEEEHARITQFVEENLKRIVPSSS